MPNKTVTILDRRNESFEPLIGSSSMISQIRVIFCSISAERLQKLILLYACVASIRQFAFKMDSFTSESGTMKR